jgi:hypothetical protein
MSDLSLAHRLCGMATPGCMDHTITSYSQKDRLVVHPLLYAEYGTNRHLALSPDMTFGHHHALTTGHAHCLGQENAKQ